MRKMIAKMWIALALGASLMVGGAVAVSTATSMASAQATACETAAAETVPVTTLERML
jgi:hypothetical protein